MKKTISHSAEETMELGRLFGSSLPEGAIVCFEGDLAAGKTTFIKGLAAGVSNCSPEEVSSPTFVYLNIYQGDRTLYHFDLYRIEDPQEFFKMGFDEHVGADGVCCIEWSERVEGLLPVVHYRVQMKHLGDDTREITIKGTL